MAGKIVTTVLLIRHGETEYNRLGKLQGSADLPLGWYGEKQARNLGMRLAGMRIGAVYSSPLSRARRTAELAFPESKIVIVPDLREQHYGRWEGTHLEDLRLSLPKSHVDLAHTAGGEEKEKAAKRMADALVRIAESHPGETVAVVAHGVVNSLAACHLLGMPLESRREFIQSNTGVTVLEYDGERWHVSSVKRFEPPRII